MNLYCKTTRLLLLIQSPKKGPNYFFANSLLCYIPPSLKLFGYAYKKIYHHAPIGNANAADTYFQSKRKVGKIMIVNPVSTIVHG